MILDGLTNMLGVFSPDHGRICEIIEECGGLDKIEDLQEHQVRQEVAMIFMLYYRTNSS